jgi:Fe-S cluster assembly scaffold protein SufB
MEKIKAINLASGLYKIKQSESYEITILPWESVTIFDDSISENLLIRLWKGANLNYFWCFFNIPKKAVKTESNWEWSQSEINILNFIKGKKAFLETKSDLNIDSTSSKISILSIIWDSWDIKIDSAITVSKGTKKCIADIRQDNILIWESAKVSWIPGLFVHTDDTSASHSLKIEKIREEDLFYLTSRWIDKNSATTIMLQSKISSLFSGFKENKDFLLEIFDNFINK